MSTVEEETRSVVYTVFTWVARITDFDRGENVMGVFFFSSRITRALPVDLHHTEKPQFIFSLPSTRFRVVSHSARHSTRN